MKYRGGKAKIKKHIIKAMKANERPEKQWFVEPFCGSCHVTAAVTGKRKASDLNHYVIAMWKAVMNGWEIPYVTKEEYQNIKKNKDNYPDELVCFAGFGCSFGGKWFGGYAQRHVSRGFLNTGEPYEIVKYEATMGSKKGILRRKKTLQGAEFRNCSYEEVEIPTNSLIYCDPPYQDTGGCLGEQFDHDKFYEWCKKCAKDGHEVYVSEYQEPPVAHELVWTNKMQAAGQFNRQNKKTEKLYKIVSER